MAVLCDEEGMVGIYGDDRMMNLILRLEYGELV